MQKKKKTSVSLMVESEIWNKTKGYSDYMGVEKGEIVATALRMYFKYLDDFEKKMGAEVGKDKGD